MSGEGVVFFPDELGGGYVLPVGYRRDISDGKAYGKTDGFHPHSDAAVDPTGALAAERHAYTHYVNGTVPVLNSDLEAAARAKVAKALSQPGEYND